MHILGEITKVDGVLTLLNGMQHYTISPILLQVKLTIDLATKTSSTLVNCPIIFIALRSKSQNASFISPVNWCKKKNKKKPCRSSTL